MYGHLFTASFIALLRSSCSDAATRLLCERLPIGCWQSKVRGQNFSSAVAKKRSYCYACRETVEGRYVVLTARLDFLEASFSGNLLQVALHRKWDRKKQSPYKTRHLQYCHC